MELQPNAIRLLALLVLVFPYAIESLKTTTTSVCFTKYTTLKPSSVPTVVSTSSQVSVSKSIVLVNDITTSTQTPDPITSTETSTSIVTESEVQTTKTNTFFDTITAVSTITSTATDVSVSTATVSRSITSTVSTTTVPTNSGFLPIASNQDVIAATKSFGKRRRRQIQTSFSAPTSPATQKTPRFKASVKCIEYVYRVVTTTSRIPSTSTVTLDPKIVKTTSVKTSTTTTTLAPPDASTTSVVTVTNTDTSITTLKTTSVTTSITTSTQVVVATAYAACQSNNIIDKVGGNYIQGVNVGDQLSTVDATSAEQCCAICQATEFCTGWMWSNYPYHYNPCYVLFASTCNAARSGWSFLTYKNGPGNPYGYPDNWLGNGGCGQGTFDGYCGFCGTG